MTDGIEAVLGRVSEYAERSMWRRGTPGLVVGITERGRTVAAMAKGVSDFRSGRQLAVDELFQIGSVSKSFTCMAILQLAEQGVIDITRPVKEYLPWFSVRSKYQDIQLHHLMTHTAGIVIGSDSTPTGWTEVWDLRHTETSCPPGTYFHYSNSGYKVLGLVLETVSGKTCERIVREGVLEGAGMRSTEPVITNGIRGRIAVPHQPTHDDRPYVRGADLSPANWFESDTADGSICAPVEDMLAYIRVLLNRGEGPWGRVLSPEGFKRMTTPYITPDDGLHTGGYGYGLNVETVNGHTYLGHQGGMVGHYTSMLMDMDSGVGAMVMVNGPGEPEEVARFAVEAMRCHLEGRPLPDVPSEEDLRRTEHASDYVGVYGGAHGTLEVVERDGVLLIRSGGREAPIERSSREEFYVHGPGLELFPLEFVRAGAKVEKVHHGGRTFVRGSPAEAAVTGPVDGIRYDGHYRSHNPWMASFRVVSREGGLVFILPHGESQPLVELGPGHFRIGADERSPEAVTFDCIIDGVATSATTIGGGRCGRTFTP